MGKNSINLNNCFNCPGKNIILLNKSATLCKAAGLLEEYVF